MKYIKTFESIYNDNRTDAKYKVNDIVKIIRNSAFSKYPVKIIHISNEYSTPEMPIYDCQVLYDADEDYIGSIIDESENDLRLATPDEIMNMEITIMGNKYNL